MGLDPSRLLAAVTRVHQRHLGDAGGADEAVREALSELLALTGAAVGFVARVRDDGQIAGPSSTPALVLARDPDRSASLLAWLRASLASEALPRPLVALAELQAPRILGYEPRLPALDNLLAVPLGRADRARPLAVLVLANRAGGFELGLVDALAPVLGACATVLEAAAAAEQRTARELELARAQQRFRTFMDASPCVAYLTDDDQRLVWASRAFCELFGVAPEAAVGRREDQLLPAGMAARTRTIDDRVRAGEGLVELLEPVVDARGEIHWWQGAKFQVEGLAGEPLIGSLAVDVTDNVRLTEALRDREAALSEAQELTRLGRWTWSPQTDVLRWDGAFERIFGRLEPGSRIAALLDRIHPDDTEAVQQLLDRLVREGGARLSVEHRALVDGEVRELLTVARIRRETDEGPLVVAMTQDVSERRRLERSRVELARAAQKYESLAVLAGGVAEELSGLFAGVLGNLGIALDELDPDSLAAACALDIEAATERGVALTEELDALAYRGWRVRGPVELSALVASLGERIHAAVPSSVSVRLALRPELPTVDGDPALLGRLVMNLVQNAAEALGTGPGELTVATGYDPVRPDTVVGLVDDAKLRPGRYVWLEVWDTGPGMDEATRARIFEPYFSTRAAGRGLGLATVLAVVRGHRGAIAVESAPGSGARVRVLLSPRGQP